MLVPLQSPEGPTEVPNVRTFREPSGDVPRRVLAGNTEGVQNLLLSFLSIKWSVSKFASIRCRILNLFALF